MYGLRTRAKNKNNDTFYYSLQALNILRSSDAVMRTPSRHCEFSTSHLTDLRLWATQPEKGVPTAKDAKRVIGAYTTNVDARMWRHWIRWRHVNVSISSPQTLLHISSCSNPTPSQRSHQWRDISNIILSRVLRFDRAKPNLRCYLWNWIFDRSVAYYYLPAGTQRKKSTFIKILRIRHSDFENVILSSRVTDSR